MVAAIVVMQSHVQEQYVEKSCIERMKHLIVRDVNQVALKKMLSCMGGRLWLVH